MTLQPGFVKKYAKWLKYKEKQHAIPIDEEEWMRAKEPSVGELPEITVTAEKEPSLYEKGIKKVAGVGETIEKAVGAVQKPLIEYGKIGIAPIIGKPLAEIGAVATGVPFEVAKRPAKDIQIPYYAEQRGKTMQGFVKNFMTKRGQEYAQEFLNIEQEMKDRGLMPEQRVITIPIDLYFMGNIYRAAHSAKWAKNFKFEWKGHKWEQKDIRSLWDRINTVGSKFSDEELAAIAELKKQGAKAWHAEQTYLRARPPSMTGRVVPTPPPTGKAIQYFRPTVSPKPTAIVPKEEFLETSKLAVKDLGTGKIYYGTEGEAVHAQILARMDEMAVPYGTEVESGFMVGDQWIPRWKGIRHGAYEVEPTGISEFEHGDIHKFMVEKALKGNQEVYAGWELDYPELIGKHVPTTAPIDIIEPIESPIISKAVGDIQKTTQEVGAQPGFVNISPMVKGYEKIHDFIFAHGEAKRLQPELYKRLMSRFHQEGASIEKAIDILNKTADKTKVIPEDDTQMAFAYEDKRYISGVINKPIYKKLFKINQMLEKFKLQRGILKQPFQERMIEENETEIKRLFEFKDNVPQGAIVSDKGYELTENFWEFYQKGGKGIMKDQGWNVRKDPETKEWYLEMPTDKIKALQTEIEKLKNMRYLPQNIAAQRAIENKIAEFEGEERTVFLERLSRISSRFIKRKSKVTLNDLVEVGLLKPEEVRLTRLTLQNIDDYYRKVAVQELHANAKMNGFIAPFTQRLKGEGWVTPREVGITAPEFKGQLLHPVYGKALEQIKEMKMCRGGAIRQLFGAVKVSQFIKPSILLFYDGVQAIMRGMYSFNPKHTAKFYNNAINDVLHKSAMYHRLNKLGLYQHPAELPRSAREETANIALNNLDASKPGWRTGLSRITGMSWNKGDITAKDIVLTPIRALAQFAWTGDKTMRTASVYALMDMGYPIEEAVEVASLGHGGYSILSPKFKKVFGYITFVQSFRVLMPMEIAKTVYEPIVGIIEAKTKGKNIPPYKKKRWAKAIIGTLIIPTVVEIYLRTHGFKTDKLGWKWKKLVKDPMTGEEREVVVTVNNIINMPLKWYHRLAYNNPISGTALDDFYNKIKWELHPIYRTGIDILTNEPSMAGELRQVYNPSATPSEKLGEITLYAMRNLFRHTELLAQAVEGETLTRKERKTEDRIMKEALIWYDRLVFGKDSPLGFGYAYARTNKEKVGGYWWRALISEHKKRIRGLAKYEDSKKKERVRESIDKWFEYCKKWLKKEYGFELSLQEEVKKNQPKKVIERGFARKLAEQLR